MVFRTVNHLPSVRDLCVEQKMIATVSAGVKPELLLRAKKTRILQILLLKAYLTHPKSTTVPTFMFTSL